MYIKYSLWKIYTCSYYIKLTIRQKKAFTFSGLDPISHSTMCL